MTRWWILLGAMFIAGAVLAAVGGTTLDVIGICLGGFAAVGALSLAFLAVGRSEDRARAEEEAARRDSAPPNGDGRLDSHAPAPAAGTLSPASAAVSPHVNCGWVGKRFGCHGTQVGRFLSL